MSPKRRVTDDVDVADAPPTEVSEVAHGDTERLGDLDENIQIAWADEHIEVDDDRRPLPMALVFLLAAVVICGISLGAYMIGKGRHQSTARAHPATAQIAPQVAPLPVPSNLPAPESAPSTVTPTPWLTVPHDAWQRFIKLLNNRGLNIDPAEQAFDDRANRHLCLMLFSNNDPAYRSKTIQSAIDESEDATWGRAEATYAIHSALQAYCPQYDG